MTYDPPAPTWLIHLCVGFTLLCLGFLVHALYCGWWISAGIDAFWAFVNAMNAYFNTLPISVRARILRFDKGLANSISSTEGQHVK
jgi:hypothetical protein